MKYWIHWHNVKYEFDKRIERGWMNLANHLPRQLRLWVVVHATNEARRIYPHPSGYAGPDGLGYKEIHDGALGYKTGEGR